jgi:hypothetical protein
VGNVHGYALYLHQGRLALTIRRWGEDTVIVSPDSLPESSVKVGAGITADGELLLLIDGEQVSAGKVAGGLPKQPGRERILAPALYAGHSPDWATSMGSYEQGTTFGDKLQNLMLRVEQE